LNLMKTNASFQGNETETANIPPIPEKPYSCNFSAEYGARYAL